MNVNISKRVELGNNTRKIFSSGVFKKCINIQDVPLKINMIIYILVVLLGMLILQNFRTLLRVVLLKSIDVFHRETPCIGTVFSISGIFWLLGTPCVNN